MLPQEPSLRGKNPSTSRALASPGSYAKSQAGKNNLQPTIDQLNGIYGDFCSICQDGDEAINDALGTDVQYCILCDSFGGIPDLNLDLPFDLCFSGTSTVQVENVGSVAMKDLSVGARILTQSGSYEPVYAWGHKNPSKAADFLQFQTKESKLEMTGGHLVFLEGKTNPVRADSIKVGDTLQGNNGKVETIKMVHREGVYTPLTPSGTVVVDGIVASSYISLQKNANEFVELQGGYSSFMPFHDGLHMAMSPFRMFTMGVSSSLGNVYNEEGIPMYAAYAMKFAKWAEQQNIVVQLVLFLAVGALAGGFLFVENTFGATHAPLAMVVGAVALSLMKQYEVGFHLGSKMKSS